MPSVPERIWQTDQGPPAAAKMMCSNFFSELRRAVAGGVIAWRACVNWSAALADRCRHPNRIITFSSDIALLGGLRPLV